MRGDESPRLGLAEDAYKRGLVPTKRYDTNHLSSTSGD